jgi:dihydrofolate reductase
VVEVDSNNSALIQATRYLVRKVILFMVISLDGFIGGPKGELDWEVRDEEVSRYLVGDLLSTLDTLLLGRVLYQVFRQAWPAMASNPSSPKELVDFAHWIEDSPKIVFSTTLSEAEWKNSRLVSVKGDDDIREEVTRLKQQPGGDMVVFGGARFAQTLIQLGLLDEYRLKLQPVALGSGLPLFKDVRDRRSLDLVKSQVFKSGVVALYYQPARQHDSLPTSR